MEKKTVGIHFGALCDPISKQLKAQGWKFDEKEVKGFQKLIEAALHLRFASLLPDSQYDKVLKKLHSKIVSHVSKLNKPSTP